MRCPLRGYIVAGIDARVSRPRDRRLDPRRERRSRLAGGHDRPRSVLFTAVYTGAARKPTTFRPFIGCVPTSGGGGRGETSVRRHDGVRARQAARPTRPRAAAPLGRVGARHRPVPGGDAPARSAARVRVPDRRRARLDAPERRARPAHQRGEDGDGGRHGFAVRAAGASRPAPAARALLEGRTMSFEAPELLLGLLLVPVAAVGYWLLQRRRRRSPSATRTSACSRRSPARAARGSVTSRLR